MALEKEDATYRRELLNLLSQEGQFALVHGDSVVDTFDTYGDALKNGYDRFGLDPFMVKKIEAIERPNFFTRDIAPYR